MAFWIQILLSNGALVTMMMSLHTGDVDKIFIDKSLMGKLSAENPCDGKPSVWIKLIALRNTLRLTSVSSYNTYHSLTCFWMHGQSKDAQFGWQVSFCLLVDQWYIYQVKFLYLSDFIHKTPEWQVYMTYWFKLLWFNIYYLLNCHGNHVTWVTKYVAFYGMA